MGSIRLAFIHLQVGCTLQASSASNGSAENSPVAGAPSCSKDRIVENGKIKAKWFVVPGSGTGELSGLRGEGGFEGHFGKGSYGTLDYWFE
jgi:hypothetical protein